MKSSQGLAFIVVICIIIFSIAYMACRSTKIADEEKEINESNNVEVVKARSIEILGSKALLTPNQDSSFWLCTHVEDIVTRYAVVDNNGHIILDKKGINGKVEWNDLTSLKTTRTPGRAEDTQPQIKIIHLKQGN